MGDIPDIFALPDPKHEGTSDRHKWKATPQKNLEHPGHEGQKKGWYPLNSTCDSELDPWPGKSKIIKVVTGTTGEIWV